MPPESSHLQTADELATLASAYELLQSIARRARPALPPDPEPLETDQDDGTADEAVSAA